MTPTLTLPAPPESRRTMAASLQDITETYGTGDTVVPRLRCDPAEPGDFAGATRRPFAGVWSHEPHHRGDLAMNYLTYSLASQRQADLRDSARQARLARRCTATSGQHGSR